MPNGKTPNELGYETRDVGWPLVLWSLGIIVVFTIISIVGLTLVFSGRESLPKMRNVQPVATAEERSIPPGPLLQARPPVDMANYKAESMLHLTTYGWVDEANGVVRVPIDQGINLALEKGFPSGAPAAPATDEPVEETATVTEDASEAEGTEEH